MYLSSIIRQLTPMTLTIGLGKPYRIWLLLFPSLVVMLLLVSCGGGDDSPDEIMSTSPTGGASTTVASDRDKDLSDKVMFIGGIPDQEAATLSRRFGLVADYLGEELGVKVEYVPSVSYAALVTAFEKGDVHLAWFGALTGVQARSVAPGAKAIAQRPRDAEFHSVFVARSDLDIEGLEGLQGKTFTFGSESSTSGHLMPRYFLLQAEIDPEEDFQGPPGFSGSHDKTWKLVESGTFQAGALGESVWESAVAGNRVDLSKVQMIYTTPAYYNYNWTIRGDVDETFEDGFTSRVQAALLAMDSEQREVLDMFQTDGFIASSNENYGNIEEVARNLDIIR